MVFRLVDGKSVFGQFFVRMFVSKLNVVEREPALLVKPLCLVIVIQKNAELDTIVNHFSASFCGPTIRQCMVGLYYMSTFQS